MWRHTVVVLVYVTSTKKGETCEMMSAMCAAIQTRESGLKSDGEVSSTLLPVCLVTALNDHQHSPYLPPHLHPSTYLNVPERDLPDSVQRLSSCSTKSTPFKIHPTHIVWILCTCTCMEHVCVSVCAQVYVWCRCVVYGEGMGRERRWGGVHLLRDAFAGLPQTNKSWTASLHTKGMSSMYQHTICTT